MEKIQYQKGKFYSLPILGIIEEDGDAYFKVKANDREYLIHMFDFQKKDPDVRQLGELPCMVKDIHGDNIVFVQNFARMFGKDYKEDESYPFIVQNQCKTEVDGKFFYNVRDLRGVTFKISTPQGIFLRPKQKIYCKVKKLSPDRLFVEYCPESKAQQSAVISPSEFLSRSGADPVKARKIEFLFDRLDIFLEARTMLDQNDNEWIIKALLAVADYWTSDSLRPASVRMLVAEYIRLCLYLLEESKLLLSFPESERENYQEWIAEKIEKAEIYSEALCMEEADRLQKEIDAILHKIRNSGFIYRPEHKISILIAIFSLRPDLLEERIDAILDIIEDTNWSRRNTEFRKAFSFFMAYYIDTKRDLVNRTALVNDETSNRLLSRMIRALSYLLLMTDDSSIDLPLYRSLLYHYLSYVRYNTTLGVHRRGIMPSETLVERAFQALMRADSGGMDLNWNSDIKQMEVFAYKMSAHPMTSNMLTTRSLESDTVRFSVNNNTISIAPTLSNDTYQNVVPAGILDWHRIQIYLPNSGKYGIQKNADIRKWKEWWAKIDHALFAKDTRPLTIKTRKFPPEVGQTVTIRVIEKDNSNPAKAYRYYCRIEDPYCHGEGWIDIYGPAATNGMFRYIPGFDIDSFYYQGEPLLFDARVNAVVDPDPECPTYMFDSMGMIDEFVKENCNHGDEVNCRIIYHDEAKHVMLAVSEFGYGVFIPDQTPDIPYQKEDTVKVRLTDISKINRIQAEVIAPADQEVITKEAAENLLYGFSEGNTFQETEDQLAKDALSLSDDQFEPEHIQQMITILDHKALMEEQRASAYGYLSIARILAKMTSDVDATKYLDQRLRMLAILEDFGKVGKVDNEEFERLSDGNEDFIENYPLLKEKLCQIKIVNSMGRQDRNGYLWDLTNAYPPSHLIGKLSRLMLSYNVSDGMQLADFRDKIVEQIKSLLNIRIAVPKIYSFGEEGQLTEFKTSVIFPPEQGMRPNKELQTFNILKVICGMANAFGGTLYLGVNDTGTAKGLDEDLAYFEGSKDKYRNYVRNHIRVAMGDSFNFLSVVEEYPEAGDKWVYALKIKPEKRPVGIRQGDKTLYFLREGASTYPFDDPTDLQTVMDERNFSDYGISLSDVTDTSADTGQTAPQEARPATKEISAKANSQEAADSIATGRIRPNPLYYWEEGFGVDNCGYLRINNDNTWTLLDEVKWEDGLLTLSLLDSERNGSLIIVYEDGETHRVSMYDILRAKPFANNKMRADKRPIFVCPAKESDALLLIYKDAKGQSVMRLDDISRFAVSKINEKGEEYPDKNLAEIQICEIIPREHHEALKPLHNLKTNSSYLTHNYYGQLQRQTLASLGVPIHD